MLGQAASGRKPLRTRFAFEMLDVRIVNTYRTGQRQVYTDLLEIHDVLLRKCEGPPTPSAAKYHPTGCCISPNSSTSSYFRTRLQPASQSINQTRSQDFTSYMLLVRRAHPKRGRASFLFQVLAFVGPVVIMDLEKMLGELLFSSQVVDATLLTTHEVLPHPGVRGVRRTVLVTIVACTAVEPASVLRRTTSPSSTPVDAADWPPTSDGRWRRSGGYLELGRDGSRDHRGRVVVSAVKTHQALHILERAKDNFNKRWSFGKSHVLYAIKIHLIFFIRTSKVKTSLGCS